MTLLDARTTNPMGGGASFSLANRMERVLWGLVWRILISWTPPPMRRYRVAMLRLFGAEVDRSANVYGSTRIWLPRNLRMAARSCLGPRVNCYCMGVISLGEGAIVSQDATLCAGNHDISDKHFQLITQPISIGRDAWVAAEAFIGPGAVVESSAVIGARATLFGVAEANGIYVGNPAKRIGGRTFGEQ